MTTSATLLRTLIVSALLGFAPGVSAAEAQSDVARDTPSEDEGDNDDRGVQPVWFSARGGYQFLDLTTFTASEEDFSADLVPTTASGPVGRLAVGAQLLGLSLGARGSIMSLSNVSNDSGVGGGTLWSLDAELGLHLATGFALDPFVLLGGGYTQIGGLHLSRLERDVRVHGYNARAGLGIDYFVGENVAIGVLAMGQVLFVTRPGVSASDLLTPKEVQTVGEAKARALQADGSSVGTALSVTAGPSFHFL